MLRGAILFVLLLLGGLVVLPFLASSLYIDQRGVAIPARVSSKREDVIVQYGTLKRSAEITAEYSKPDGSGVSFLTVRLSPAEYDTIHVGQAVSLHYLRPQDLPDLPFVKSLRRAQLLPTVRLANQRIFSAFQLQFTKEETGFAAAIAGVVLLLFFWRIARAPGFGWALGGCVLLGIVALFVSDFPRPTPAPTSAVRQILGRVKSLERIDRVFAGSHSRGLVADQPIEVAGIEFIPEGRTEPVLAVDLIDAGSVAGLKEKTAVLLDYESAAPRTAYIRGATRRFVSRNIAGIGVQGAACLLVLIVFLVGAQFLGRAYNRLTRRT